MWFHGEYPHIEEPFSGAEKPTYLPTHYVLNTTIISSELIAQCDDDDVYSQFQVRGHCCLDADVFGAQVYQFKTFLCSNGAHPW